MRRANSKLFYTLGKPANELCEMEVTMAPLKPYISKCPTGHNLDGAGIFAALSFAVLAAPAKLLVLPHTLPPLALP